MDGQTRLTGFSHGAGCACKLGPAELTEVLRHLPAFGDARVLVDASTRDDAAVVALDAERAIVATTDFFTPIVDDPHDWGAIAAANALSDLYAMGAEPLLALSLVAWPRTALPFDLLGLVIEGATVVAREASCPIVGGHSVDAPEPLFGLAAIGMAHPDRLLTVGAARPGDQLVLTKPIGTGILTTALKRDRLAAADIRAAVTSMRTLNAAAAWAAQAHKLKSATDVTGFGLLGHLGNMTAASGVAAELWFDAIPLLPHAAELARGGVAPGGTARNLEAMAERTEWDASLDEAARRLVADPQTSGGLLLAVPSGLADAVVADLLGAGTLAAAVVGQLTDGAPGAVHVRARRA